MMMLVESCVCCLFCFCLVGLWLIEDGMVQAVQYVQDNPDEVCPAGWKPGEKTMKPDSKLSKEYFEAI